MGLVIQSVVSETFFFGHSRLWFWFLISLFFNFLWVSVWCLCGLVIQNEVQRSIQLGINEREDILVSWTTRLSCVSVDFWTAQLLVFLMTLSGELSTDSAVLLFSICSISLIRASILLCFFSAWLDLVSSSSLECPSFLVFQLHWYHSAWSLQSPLNSWTPGLSNYCTLTYFYCFKPCQETIQAKATWG